MSLDTMATRATAPFSAASRQIGRAVRGVADLVALEAWLTLICAGIPLILIVAEGWPPTEAISGFYDMQEAELFYMPLTVAAMLFIVNGTVKKGHWYNVYLGLSLAGLTLLNTDDFHTIHVIFTACFFVGNALVFVIFSPKRELWFKFLLAALMAVAIAAWYPLGWIDLFWAESLSLWVIAGHFLMETLGIIR